MEGHWKFLGGGGGQKAKILEAKYEAFIINLNFLGGDGVQNKKPSVGGVWIYISWNCTFVNTFLVCPFHKFSALLSFVHLMIAYMQMSSISFDRRCLCAGSFDDGREII